MNQQEKRNSAEGTNPAPANTQWSEIVSLVKSVAIFLCIALMLRATVVEAFKIPSSSMMPTLEIGDHILVNKMSYGVWLPLIKESLVQFDLPQRGDIVVFTLPDNPNTPEVDESDTNVIKRVIGVPGDQVEVQGTKVIVNGKVLVDEWGRWLQGGYRNFPRKTVPEGHFFMLGDNRDYSKDSRFWANPFLPISRIKGRAFVIYWNAQFRFGRIFTSL
jgi:signal peptidase I